ncbi:hypothetical protein BHYA_0108g00070 [Botrytis hyacinthi]|uniref:Uncharacterized protein n=1 Tax=Botrytis hyacinthi TaxID=278943 RepID=A0A4Z1GQN9_9HELO|nr:hypothetical protein BHYA_0108g00070 [Botrytis hyacinthi]
MFSKESVAKAQPRPKNATPEITLPVKIMEKSTSESEEPKSNANPPQFQFPDLDDPKKSDIFIEATLKVLRRMVFPYNEDKIRTMSPILDEYLSIWSEISVDKSNSYHSKIENLCMLDLNLMIALVAMQEKRDELWLGFSRHENFEDYEGTPEFREVYCPNCDDSSEEDESEDLFGNEESMYTATTYSASEMAKPKIPADTDDCSCLCVMCCASRGLDSDDDSYVYPSSDSESEDDVPCQCQLSKEDA